MALIDPTNWDARTADRALWEWLDLHRAATEREAEATIVKIPVFARLLDSMTVEFREAQAARSRELQRLALVEGDWGPLEEDLRQQGRMYARLGIAFADWFPLLGVLRQPLVDRLPDEREERRRLLAAMNQYVDRSMATLGQTYVDEKQDLVRHAEQQLRTWLDMVHFAPLGMVLLRWESPPDPGSFRFVSANPAAAQLSPSLAGDAVGRRLDELPAGLVPEHVLGNWVESMQSGAPRSWVNRIERPDGSLVIHVGSCTPLPDQHLGLIVQDVTERRRLQAAVARHVKELERSNRELDDFAYVASHDLRSPLQDIRSLGAWIAEDLGEGLPEGTRRHVALLQDRVRRMERLLEDLLEYSRVGRFHEAPREFSPADVLHDVAALLGPPPGFAIRYDGPAPRIRTPRTPFEKVLRNLVANALKHHDRPGGTVEVTAEPAGAGRIVVRVRDDGPGIPPEFHERVFRVFQTLRPRDEVEGSGVGLAIVKKTVEWFRGEVGIDSSGRGTTVWFTWPVQVEGGDA